MESALAVRSAYKRYGNSVVLNGLNMDVPQGAIYGLLGPSGCGKTTLLSCIVGRIQLDAGQITTKAKKKADVGYMPQDVALYNTLSILETFLYYGRLYGMSRREVYLRTEELIRLLELKSAGTIIDKLSGGQQRRVSFAVALLHDPQLLILDEPTVGLDPVLSHSIWEHLLKLTSNDKKSIIITTHYIEEARQAHVVGLMRGGVLLAEESPNQLMASCGSDTLEHAFLELSARQHGTTGSDDELDKRHSYPEKQKPLPQPPLQNGDIFATSRFVAQLIKNLFFMWRNKPMMLFLLGLPILQCTLYNLAIGRDPQGLKLAVVNDELEHGLSDCGHIPSTGCHLDLPLSCRYLMHMRGKTLSVVEYHNLEEAEAVVRSNKAWGIVHFGHNYTEALVQRIEDFQNADPDIIEDAMVNVRLDMSNQYIGNLLRTDLVTSYAAFLRSVFRDCEWPEQAIDVPIKVNDPVYGSRRPSFLHFASPAVIILFEFYLPVMFTVGVLLQEKMAGILERSMVAGLTALEIVLAHSLIQFVVLLIQTSAMLLVMYKVFDSPFIGDFYWTTGLLLLQGVCGMCYGFLVSVVAETMTTASFMGMGSFFPLCLTSGMVWPQEGMHPVLRSVGWLLPLSLSTESIRSLTARGWTIHHRSVYYGYISTLIWIAVFLAAITAVVRIKRGIRSSK
ncbi:ABC transporter G family member 20-like [Macrosteles quadrilineatus]|uniref:ABC transporter G family member 20-like n=1 Tax=Macrosteles quadrilineatus TaxID=74068 RepID=UPI0023E0935E|nr:ABC transporter G family member 20-like [Macrosteles quadrilineatus]